MHPGARAPVEQALCVSQCICILIYTCVPSGEPHKKTLGKEFVKAPLGQRAAPALGKSKQFSLASDGVVGEDDQEASTCTGWQQAHE
jgi:hypothetical protein